jgi:hypothetical protein
LDESLPAPVKARFLLNAAKVDLQLDLSLARKVEARNPHP